MTSSSVSIVEFRQENGFLGSQRRIFYVVLY